AVPRVALNMVTASLVAQSAEALRGLNYDKQNWQQVYSASGNITVNLPDGTTFTGPSWKYLSDNMATKSGGAVPVNQGGTGSTTAAGARTNLGLGNSATMNVGTAAGTVAAGDDARLGTVNGKTGGTISSSVNITGNCITSHGNGFGVGTSGNYKLEINSSATEPTATDGPIAWSITRWYSDAVMLVSRRSGSTTIKSQGIQFANGNQFEFLSTGSATCPGTFQGGSDERHKFNIELVKDPLASVLSFRGVTYDKKDGLPEVGLIAQDVERACPVAVSSSDDRIFRDGTVIPNFKYLNTAGTAAAFHTEAIKELLMLIEISIDDPQTAKERIAALKTKANEIAQREIENAAPWMEGPPDFNPKANGEGNSVQE
ncbi:tail fiber domain-containing protein, partial [Enterobacter roggenkampii]|uniref:tail fiber domain-containing protein n=1 Tax=Enterobacter roggenkampii TaxID=1812935 RepID=UPI001E6273FF